MTFSASEKRLTRSQVRAGASAVASETANGASTPSSATPGGPTFSKAGRRVLAELACNDSPVVGLLPAGTPKDKSSDGGLLKSRRALLADIAPTQSACTPLGESLLRSQVQLLLQKVGSDMCTYQPEKAPSLYTGNTVLASPTMLAAPTPLNTPASILAMAQMPEPKSQYASTDTAMGDAENNSLSAASMSGKQLDLKYYGEAAENHCLDSVSTTLCVDEQPSLLLEVIDPPSSTEIFPGKRVLHFDEDTPCKSMEETPSSRVSFFKEIGHTTPAMRPLDDDEASEWSVNVNVGSPAEKLCQGEASSDCIAIGDTLSSGSEEALVLHDHVKMMQLEPSSKVHFLWDEDMERKEVQKKRDIDRICEAGDENADEENDEEEYSEEYYSEEEEEDEDGYGGEECDDLCDMMREMGFGEEKQGLPRGEGKHIRFLYDEDEEDEVVEAMEVKGEMDLACSGEAVLRLKGLPAPLGRHCRFAGDEEEEDEDHGC